MGRLQIVEIGERYGRLEVIERRDSGSQKYIRCRCECGSEKLINAGHLIGGRTISCGCYSRELTTARNTTHGMRRTRAYSIWSGMIDRCTNPNREHYLHYGGRGIIVDPRWLIFEKFYEDMGNPPDNMTLDRKDNDLGYSKDNCRWATRSEQASNRRGYGSSLFRGVTRSDNKWIARRNGVYLGLFFTEEEAVQAVAEYEEDT